MSVGCYELYSYLGQPLSFFLGFSFNNVSGYIKVSSHEKRSKDALITVQRCLNTSALV